VNSVSDLVTGEAVVLDLRLARLASRGLAFALDVLVQLAVVVILALIVQVDTDQALQAALALLIIIAVLLGYPVTFETLTRGRSLGKLALGLRVVRDDGGPIRFRHALVRGLAGVFVDFWALGLGGVVAVFVSLSSTKGKRVGDFLAGTVVVRERLPRHGGAPVTMPPYLAEWAASLDLSRLPSGLALAARQYLGRLDHLSPGAAHHLGAQLAADVSRYLGMAVPPAMPPWTYLSAVLAERRAREEARMGMAARQAPAPPSPPTPPAPQPSPGRDADGPFAPPT
jgi:uncharacterized RDD family membrane protein YckC